VAMKEAKEMCSNVMRPITKRFSPITDRVGSVAQYGMSKINGAKDYTLNTANEVKSYGVDKVDGMKSFGMNKVHAVTDVATRQASRLFDNQAGRAVLTNVDKAIDVVDSYVNRYLPEEDKSAVQKAPVKDKKDEGKQEEQPAMVFNKAVGLGCRIGCRVYNRVVTRVKTVKEMVTVPVVSTVTKTSNNVTATLATVAEAAWVSVNNLADFVTKTLTRSRPKKECGSDVEEIPSDTSNTEPYDDRHCVDHGNSSNSSSD